MRRIIIAAAMATLLGACSHVAEWRGEKAENSDTAMGESSTLGSATTDARDKSFEQFAIDEVYKAHPTRMLANIVAHAVERDAGNIHRITVGMGGSSSPEQDASAYKKLYEVQISKDADGLMRLDGIKDVTGQ